MFEFSGSLDLADFWLDQLESSYFVDTFVHEDMEQTMEKLKKYRIHAVTPGSIFL